MFTRKARLKQLAELNGFCIVVKMVHFRKTGPFKLSVKKYQIHFVYSLIESIHYLRPLTNVRNKHSKSYFNSITDNQTRTFVPEGDLFTLLKHTLVIYNIIILLS